MQQIERYGVIALVFLLVTIVAVSFWGDSKSPGFWSRLTGKSDGKKEQTEKPVSVALVSDHVVDPNLPLSDAGAGLASNASNLPLVPLANGNTPSATDTPAIGNATIQSPDGFDRPLAPGTMIPAGTPAPAWPVAASNAPATPFAPLVPAPVATSSREYVVQKGDSLARIASQKLGSESRWREIQAANPGLDPKRLSVGQKILLPEGAASAVSKPTVAAAVKPAAPKPNGETAKVAKSSKPAASKSGATRAYVVKKGDLLSTIAAAQLGDAGRWQDIVAANPGLDAKKLAVGQTIQLPGGAPVERKPVLAAAAVSSGKPRVR